MYLSDPTDGQKIHVSFGPRFTMTGDCRTPFFFIGTEQQLAPGLSMYRLVGERPDVWRQYDGPLDDNAYRFFRDEIGSYLERVMNRPEWIFTQPPASQTTRYRFEPEVRLVDGLLCGTRHVCRNTGDEPDDWDASGPIEYIVQTEAGCYAVEYHRPDGSGEAYLVHQKPWTPCWEIASDRAEEQRYRAGRPSQFDPLKA